MGLERLLRRSGFERVELATSTTADGLPVSLQYRLFGLRRFRAGTLPGGFSDARPTARERPGQLARRRGRRARGVGRSTRRPLGFARVQALRPLDSAGRAVLAAVLRRRRPEGCGDDEVPRPPG